MMKYKVGDKIVLHSKEWFDNNERSGRIRLGLNKHMRKYFGKTHTIIKISTTSTDAYCIEEDEDDDYVYGDEMIDHDKTKDLHRRLDIERRLKELSTQLFQSQLRVHRSPDSGEVLRGFNPADYEWDIEPSRTIPCLTQSFPEYAEKFTPIIDEGVLYFADDENNTYTLKELFERYGKI